MVEEVRPAWEALGWEERFSGIQALSAATLLPIMTAMPPTCCPGGIRRMAEVIIDETKLDSLSETPGSARASPHDYSLPVDLKFAPDSFSQILTKISSFPPVHTKKGVFKHSFNSGQRTCSDIGDGCRCLEKHQQEEETSLTQCQRRLEHCIEDGTMIVVIYCVRMQQCTALMWCHVLWYVMKVI